MRIDFKTLSAGATAGLVGALASAAYLYLLARAAGLGPGMTMNALYPKVAAGALWGLVFMIPLLGRRWWQRGVVFGLAVWAIWAFVIYDGSAMPDMPIENIVISILSNLFWGLAGAWWYNQAA